MKFIHNEKLSLAWAVLVEIVVHLLFAFQAFLLGAFLGELALQSIFGAYVGMLVGAWALAIFVFGAAFQAFVLGEYMREHVESFETTAKGNGSYIRSWKQVRWLVAGLEIASLLFRCIVVTGQGNLLQAIIVGSFGAIALWYAFAQAKVIHASVNRPVEYDVTQARAAAGKDLVKGAIRLVPKMTPEQKQRFYTGDLTAISEVYTSETDRKNEKLRPKEEKRSKEKQRQKAQEENYRTAQGYTGKLLGGSDREDNFAAGYDPKLGFLDAQSNPGHHLSNGRRN